MLNESARFERFTVFKPPALPEVFDTEAEMKSKDEHDVDTLFRTQKLRFTPSI
jgi:hypothetical protein